MVELDKLDRNLLYELNWDCRQTNSELAKKLRTSKQVINYRIKRFEDSGFIQGYSTLIDWRKLGYNSIRIYIKWKNLNPDEEEKIYSYIRENSLFMWSVKFEGEFDLGIYVWIKEIKNFYDEWKEFLEKYKKNILKQEIFESVNMVNYPLKFLKEVRNVPEKIIGLGKEVDFDNKDFLLLKEISSNARMQIIDLENKLKMTSKAIIYRIKNLEKKGIILGYNAIINFEKLGFTFYKIDFYLNDLSELDEMFTFAKNHKKIIYLMKTIGGPEYEVEALVKNVKELNDLINEIRSQFKNKIEYYRFHSFGYTIKQVYLPGC